MTRLLQVAFITFVLSAILHAQRVRSGGGHVSGLSHPSASFSGHGPSSQRQPQRYPRPHGNYRGGVSYRARYPYFYPGYPGLLGLPLGYGNYLEEDSPPLAPQPPIDNSVNEVPEFRPAYQPQTVTAPVHAEPATTLVFSDGRPRIEVHNYALTGNTLYALDGETRREIPLSQLNLPATIEANRQAGVDFALPNSH